MSIKVATPKSIKLAKQWFAANPNGKMQVSWCERWTEKDFKRWLRSCVHARASRGLNMTGRKFTSDYHFTMLRFSREINNPRLIIRYIPALDNLRTRFANRLFTGE